MDNENINGTGSVSPQEPAVVEAAAAPDPAPYYRGQTHDPAPENVSQPERGAGQTAPWRDPEYRPETAMRGSVYSPTGGYYGYNAYGYAQPAPSRQTPPKTEKKSHRGFWNTLLIVLLCVSLSAASTGIVLWAHDSRTAGTSSQAGTGIGSAAESPTEPAPPAAPDADSGSDSRFSSTLEQPDISQHDTFTSKTDVSVTGNVLSPMQIYELACEQVVGINYSVTSRNIFDQTTSTACVGTGFVISDDGYIMTCYHVVEEALVYGYDVSVLFYDESEYPATLVGYDEDSDVAVLKINVDGMNPVTLGRSGELQVGQTIYAVGNPLGELTYTMTDGIVSALNREISTSISPSLYVFQINAAVNSGNSGGPVYNDRGMVVGMVDAKYQSSGIEGLSFALPIDTINKAAQEIIEKGYVSGKAFLGVAGETVESFAKHYYGLPDGVIISSVEPDSAADKAGLRQYDIITAINGEKISSRSGLQTALRRYSAGDTVTITIYRSGNQSAGGADGYIDIEVTLGEKIPSNITG